LNQNYVYSSVFIYICFEALTISSQYGQ